MNEEIYYIDFGTAKIKECIQEALAELNDVTASTFEGDDHIMEAYFCLQEALEQFD